MRRGAESATVCATAATGKRISPVAAGVSRWSAIEKAKMGRATVCDRGHGKRICSVAADVSRWSAIEKAKMGKATVWRPAARGGESDPVAAGASRWIFYAA